MSGASIGRSWLRNVEMHLKLVWLNCLWLMMPLLLWNLFLGPQISDARITSDAHSPAWLLIAENITRMVVFALPLLLPLRLKDTLSKAGLGVYSIGTLIYFASWLPLLLAPASTWSNSALGLLAPRLTPFLPFLGIALIGRSWSYGLLVTLFVLLHTWHGIQNL
jgi:hypothetical protein